MNTDTRRQLLDRMAALHDHIDDIEVLLPPTPHSMSGSQLRIAGLIAHIRNELAPLLAEVRNEVQ